MPERESTHDDGCRDFYPQYGEPEGGVCHVCGDAADVGIGGREMNDEEVETVLETLESYWSAELGETVDIVPVGWSDSPAEFRLLIGGTDVVSYRRLEEIEFWLEVYFMKTGEEHVG